MTRRPRPTHRPTRLPNTPHVRQLKAQVMKQAQPKAIDFMSKSKSSAKPLLSTPKVVRFQDARHDDDEGSDDQDPSSEQEEAVDAPPVAQWINEEESDDDQDSSTDQEEAVDAPRVVQWVDDEQLEPVQASTSDDGSPSGSDSESDHDDVVLDDDHTTGKAEHSRRLRSLEEDLSTLPLGTLRNAQRSLAKAKVVSDTDAESDSEVDSWQGNGDVSTLPSKDKDNKPRKPRNDLAKRVNKHAPTEITSKRPVSRRRVVVDDQLPKPRDPRFVHSVSQYDASKFKRGYDFLSSLRKDELSTLREHLKRARKFVTNSPAHLRTERQEEVNRLERAMKRAESTVNMDNRERVELEAIQAAKQTEKEKRKRGKNEWWMKHSEKKQLLVTARIDAIAAAGGKQAVKKAIEKKQKKISQKDKKMRPFPRSGPIESSNGEKRRPVESVDSRGSKRRRIV